MDEKKDIGESLSCTIKVLEHIKKTGKDCEKYYENINKQDNRSKNDITIKSMTIKLCVLSLCSIGQGKRLCDVFDKVKEEESKLKRRLYEDEIRDIIIKVLRDSGIEPVEQHDNNIYTSMEDLVTSNVRNKR